MIRNKCLSEEKIYDVKDESRQIRTECKLVQQTDFLFIFKPIKIRTQLDKREICISKVNWFLNPVLAKELCYFFAESK